nr:bifunctional aminoglycoside phosphotransferase/ATP-binding protein [Pseudomonas sp. NW5]
MQGFSVSQTLIDALQNPALYPHPVEGFQVIETHISWVLLTGPYAYKLKKPVNFGFLDFSSLEAREHFCHEEVRLNRRTAPDLYLEVIPLTGSLDALQLGGEGPVLDHLIKMRQFDQHGLLDHVQARGELHAAHIDALARVIADLHTQAAIVPVDHPLGGADAVMAPVLQNFEQSRALLEDAADLAQLDRLENWAQTAFNRLQPLLEQRKQDGFVRECHGDIHLANVTLLEGEVRLFDCIEFNEPFRLIDVICDVAFVTMDLEDRGLQALSQRLINHYLELTGDYAGLALLRFYKAYRAMVRAKICLFGLQPGQSDEERQALLARYRRYAALAEGYSRAPRALLAITHGVSAVGKSLVALQLVEALGAIRLRSDVERKRLLPDADEATLYSAAASQQTYARLHQLAAQILADGYPVVLDATYLTRAQREAARQVAEQAGVELLILDCQAPLAQIHAWLAERQASGGDPSDATEAVIAAQLAAREPLDEAERAHSVLIDTTHADSLAPLLARLGWQ